MADPGRPALWARFGSWVARLRPSLILKWLTPPRRLKLTREGRYYILITFGVGFVGILTANNLLYLLLGMLLSLIIVSGMLSDTSLRNIRVTRRLPHRAQVGRPHLVEVQVWNDKKRMPSYAIEVEDLRVGQPADKRCFFLKVSPESSQVAAYRRIPARRGLDRHIGFRVATRFPFGLFEKSRTFTSEADVIIYPAVDPVRLPVGATGARGEGRSAMTRGSGEEVMGLRVMRDGDDPRDIYWRRSVLPGQRIVVDRARDVRQRVRLQLDNIDHDGTPTAARRHHFELMVRDVASRSVAHVRRGDDVVVEAKSGLSVAASPSTGTDPLLRFLALIELEQEGTTASGSRPVHWAQSHQAGSGRAARAPVLAVMPQLSRPANLPTKAGELEDENAPESE